MPLFLHQMDDLAARGCQTPGCTHEAHAGGLYLNQRCHPGTGVRVQYADDAHPEPCAAVLVLHCQRCAADVCSIALSARPALVPACQHTRGLEVVYDEGTVTITCRACHAPYATIDVAVHGPML
jgi:hypothetical protein